MSGIANMIFANRTPPAVGGGSSGASAFYPGPSIANSNLTGTLFASFGTGNFTVEMWLYDLSATNAERPFFDNRTGQNNAGWALRTANNSNFIWIQGASSNAITTAANTRLRNEWQHIAIVRNGSGTNNIRLYSNGTQIGQATNTYNYTSTNMNLGMFVDWAGANSCYYGYIDEVRVSNIARYTGSFTPSTTPFTVDANTLHLYHMDGANNSTTFTDDTGRSNLTTNRVLTMTATSNVVISTTQVKF